MSSAWTFTCVCPLLLRLPLGVLWALLLACVWLWLLEVPDPQTIPYYGSAVVLFALSGVQELLAEPLWVLAQAHMFVRLKVVAESLAMIAKCSITVVLVVFAREWGLYIFSAAHVRDKVFLHYFCKRILYTLRSKVLPVLQVLYTGSLVLCYVVYFVHLLSSKGAAKKSFPLDHVRELLPCRADGEVLVTKCIVFHYYYHLQTVSEDSKPHLLFTASS